MTSRVCGISVFIYFSIQFKTNHLPDLRLQLICVGAGISSNNRALVGQCESDLLLFSTECIVAEMKFPIITW